MHRLHFQIFRNYLDVLERETKSTNEIDTGFRVNMTLNVSIEGKLVATQRRKKNTKNLFAIIGGFPSLPLSLFAPSKRSVGNMAG